MAEVVGRFPNDARWRTGHFGVIASIAAFTAGGDMFLERGRVAMEPGLRFGAAGAGHVRLNFGTSAEILDEATKRMAAAVAG